MLSGMSAGLDCEACGLGFWEFEGDDHRTEMARRGWVLAGGILTLAEVIAVKASNPWPRLRHLQEVVLAGCMEVERVDLERDR